MINLKINFAEVYQQIDTSEREWNLRFQDIISLLFLQLELDFIILTRSFYIIVVVFYIL